VARGTNHAVVRCTVAAQLAKEQGFLNVERGIVPIDTHCSDIHKAGYLLDSPCHNLLWSTINMSIVVAASVLPRQRIEMNKMYRVTGKEKTGFAVVDGHGATVYDLLDSKEEAIEICAILNDGIGLEWDAVEEELTRRRTPIR